MGGAINSVTTILEVRASTLHLLHGSKRIFVFTPYRTHQIASKGLKYMYNYSITISYIRILHRLIIVQ